MEQQNYGGVVEIDGRRAHLPRVRATSDAVKLSVLTAGVPAVLHMYTS